MYLPSIEQPFVLTLATPVSFIPLVLSIRNKPFKNILFFMRLVSVFLDCAVATLFLKEGTIPCLNGEEL